MQRFRQDKTTDETAFCVVFMIYCKGNEFIISSMLQPPALNLCQLLHSLRNRRCNWQAIIVSQLARLLPRVHRSNSRLTFLFFFCVSLRALIYRGSHVSPLLECLSRACRSILTRVTFFSSPRVSPPCACCSNSSLMFCSLCVLSNTPI